MMNLVRIEKTVISETVVKWENVVGVNLTDSIEKVAKIVISSGHTRLPILKERKVVGLLNSKEFFAFQRLGSSDWASLARPIVTMEESTPLLSALRILQEKRTPMAIVYRGPTVTMEDIFEEIIGDIYDEDDDEAIKKILSSRRYF